MPLPEDIGDRHAAVGVVDRDEVVVIAAHLARGNVDARELKAGTSGALVGSRMRWISYATWRSLIHPAFSAASEKRTAVAEGKRGLLGDGFERGEIGERERVAGTGATDQQHAEGRPRRAAAAPASRSSSRGSRAAPTPAANRCPKQDRLALAPDRADHPLTRFE